MSKVKVCSLFSGIGGFETGIFNALGKDNVEVVFASEIDKYASMAYEHLYGHKPHGDITKIHEQDVPDHDILVGGFPCQAFSVSGKRLGFEDTRGTLFFEIARIAKEKRPRMMVLENVKGLVGHDKGKTLDVIAQTLSELDYKIDMTVLNSKYFGVPQNRERIFIICHRDAVESEWEMTEDQGVISKAKKRLAAKGNIKTFNFDFPKQANVDACLRDILDEHIEEKYFLKSEKLKEFVAKSSESATDIKKIGFIKKDREPFRVHTTEGIMPTIMANNQGGRSPGGLILDNKRKLNQIGYIDKNSQGNRVYSIDGVGPTVSSQTGGLGGSGGGIFAIHGFESEDFKHQMEEEIRSLVSKSRPNEEISIKFKENGDIRPHRNDPRKSGLSELNINYEENQSFTVTATHAPKIYGYSTDWRIRKLSPLECFRLQGFPDGYHRKLKEHAISDSQLYKMAGNAVTTNVIQAIFQQLKPYIK